MSDPVDPIRLAANLLIVAAAIVFPTLLLGYAILRSKRRTRSLRAIAKERGWSFDERDDSLAFLLDRFEIGKDASRRLCLNVMRFVVDGRNVVTFDLHRTGDANRPGAGFTSQTVLLCFGARTTSIRREGTLSSLPRLARDHLPKIEIDTGVATYHIADFIVAPGDIDRFVNDALSFL